MAFISFLSVIAFGSIQPGALSLPAQQLPPSSTPPIPPQDPTTLLSSIVEAVGGLPVLSKVSSFRYNASTIYRSQTLTQNYNLEHSDQTVASAGTQIMTFNISSSVLQERIDRWYNYNDYWIWAFPNLQPPINVSLVVQNGQDGFACFNRGQNTFYAENPVRALGYADPYLTDYLVNQAHQFAMPWLLKEFTRNTPKLSAVHVIDPVNGEMLKGLHHAELGLTLLVNTSTNLPYIIRSYEDHVLFGKSTNDLLLSDYRAVLLPGGTPAQELILPHRFQTVYNSKDVLEDFVVDHLTLNPSVPPAYFDAADNIDSQHPRSSSTESAEYPRSEVHEFFETGLWGGAFGEYYSVADVVIERPLQSFNNVLALHVGYTDYVQLLVEFEHGVLVTDGPAHRSKIIIDWVHQNLNKNITHVVPSHHHHDHSTGVGDYVADGAKLVVPEVAKHFYAHVNGGDVQFITYNADEPFILKDAKVQFRSMWREESPHARDWIYGMVTSACPTEPDVEMAVFVADVVSPGSDALRWDSGYARQWLLDAVNDGLPATATIVGAHGSTDGGNSTTDTLLNISRAIGFDYPALTLQDWRAGGELCL